jgi:hypothetical protein
MRRALVLSVCLIILAVVWLSRNEAVVTVAQQSATVESDPVVDSADPAPPATIRVVHELVHVPVFTSPERTTPPPAPMRRARMEPSPEPPTLASRARRLLFGDGQFTSPERTTPPPPNRRARSPEPPRPAGGARRVLFGDGHYRPEPFPRPTKH